MVVLAEISDKIFLPGDAFGLGCLVGLLVFVVGVLMSVHTRLWILFLCWCAFVVFLSSWGLMVDRDLAEAAEREIPGYHMRMRLAMGGPSLVGVVGAWLIGGRFYSKRYRGECVCVGCGYSLVGLDGGVCPECGGEG